MAKKDDNTLASGRIKKLANSIQGNVNSLYQNTYYSPADNKRNIEQLQRDMNRSLDNIIDNNMTNSGVPNISTMYHRILNKQDGAFSGFESFDTLFEDESMLGTVMDAYVQNKYIRALDEEIDVICKYMPKLLEAVDTKKDNVLCADQFSKEYLNITSESKSTDKTSFNNRIDTIKEKYNLTDVIEDAYFEASKYGEKFLYIVPYKKAFEKIFANRNKMKLSTGYYTEAMDMSDMAKTATADVSFKSDTKQEKDMAKAMSEFIDSKKSINISFNTSNTLEEAILSRQKVAAKLGQIADMAVNESSDFFNEVVTTKDKLEKDKIIPDDLEIPDGDVILTNVPRLGGKKFKDSDIADIPGCIVKPLERHKVIPLYVEDLCLGYYYIDIDTDIVEDGMQYTSMMSPSLTRTGTKNLNGGINQMDPIKNDLIIKKLANELSLKIDSKFINSNQDISRELYMILRYDEKFNRNTTNINITFIPPDDMVHVYFKLDPKTHRGISDLERALIPAKIWVSLYMTYAVGLMTRGQDKRVYYVKQQVETNISQTLMNAVNQIKKGNFGVRHMENLMNTLNITGRFNDYFIPTNGSNDYPIQFEILPGQNIDPKMEFMDKIEEYAINSTDVPLELINARQSVDYALQLTMTSSKFVRKVYNRQAQFQRPCSRIVTKLYNGEFKENAQLKVKLPPPLYLQTANAKNLIDNIVAYSDAVVRPRCVASKLNDTQTQIAINAYAEKQMGSYADFDEIQEIIDKAKKTESINSEMDQDE